MLQRGRLEDFDPGNRAGYEPCSLDQDLRDRFREIGGKLKLIDLLATLEDPNALGGVALYRIAPCREDLLPPSKGGRYIERCLGPGHENEVQTTAEIVRLQRLSDRSCDLESSFAKRDGCEGHICRRDKTDGLKENIEIRSNKSQHTGAAIAATTAA